MNRVIESSRLSLQTVPAIGIAVYAHGGHIGLAYRVAEGEAVEILHLAGHLDLKSEAPTAAYVCWVNPGIAEDRANAIGALCRRIWKQNKNERVTYGFSAPGQFFTASGRQYKVKGPAAVGLTCASFVLEVFEKARLPLIRAPWPPPSDQDIADQTNLLLHLRQDHPKEKEHADAVEKEIGNIRYAPLQVAGAGTCDTLPADYPYANTMAAAIRELLAKIREEYRRSHQAANDSETN